MMMHVNPYADEILEECGDEIEDLRKPILALLSIQKELAEANRIARLAGEAERRDRKRAVNAAETAVEISAKLLVLQEALLAPPRFVLGNQDPISPEDLKSQMRSTKLMAIPDDSGDARIAAAARRWAEAYGNRNMPGKAAAHHLASSELLEVVRQEDER